MGNMLPGNSFPQICVVSVNHPVGIVPFEQDYGRSVDLSNLISLLISNGRRAEGRSMAALTLAALALAAIHDAGGLQQ